MRSFSLAIVLAAAPVAAAAPGETEPQLGETLQRVDAYVYHCNDGDTCRVRVAGGMWLNVRLAGIDAPEVSSGRKKGAGQPMGVESRDALNAKVKGKDVKLQQTDLDQYNRPVVEIYAGDVLVNKAQVEEGWAEVYRGKAKRLDRAPYEVAEAEAKKAKKGVWSLAGYESPKDWRKEKKKN